MNVPKQNQDHLNFKHHQKSFSRKSTECKNVSNGLAWHMLSSKLDYNPLQGPLRGLKRSEVTHLHVLIL